MKKLLNFLLISSLTGTVISSSNLLNINQRIENNKPLITKTNHLSLGSESLNSVISETALGDILIPANASDTYEKSAVINALWRHNPNLDISQIEIQFMTSISAVVAAIDSSGSYYGTVRITYNMIIGSKTQLKSVLVDPDLGEIKTSNDTPSEAELKAAIKDHNKAIVTDHISVQYITDSNALVMGDNVLYTGTVGINFYTNHTTDLSQFLTVTDLDKVQFSDKLNDDDLLTALVNKNSGVIKDHVMVTNLTNNGATIIGDGVNYTGRVNIKFKTIIATDLTKAVTVTALGTIKVAKPDADTNNYYAVLMNELLGQNPSLNITWIEIKAGVKSITGSSTTAKIEGIAAKPNLAFQRIYIGSVDLTFSFQNS